MLVSKCLVELVTTGAKMTFVLENKSQINDCNMQYVYSLWT